MPSRLFVYYFTRQLMGTINYDSGVDNRSMMQALQQFGYCDERLWPYDIGAFRHIPNQQAIANAGARAFKVIYESVPQDLASIKAAIFDRTPVLIGFTVYSNIWDDAVTSTGDIQLPRLSDSVDGGHDVDAVGWDDDKQRFKIRNSWGDWGNGGYGTLPYAYVLDPDLAGDFWRLVPGDPLTRGATAFGAPRFSARQASTRELDARRMELIRFYAAEILSGLHEGDADTFGITIMQLLEVIAALSAFLALPAPTAADIAVPLRSC